MSLPVVTVAAGGLPVVQLAGAGGLPVTEAASARGLAVTKVASRGLPVTFVDASGAVVPPLPPFASWEPATVAAVTLSGSNLVATNTGTTSANQGARVAAASGKAAGQYYFEATLTSYLAGQNTGVGVGNAAAVYSTLGSTALNGAITFCSTGNIYNNGGNSSQSLGPRATGNVFGIAVDLTLLRIWTRVAPAGNWNGIATAVPGTGGAGWLSLPAGVHTPVCIFGGVGGVANNVITANFGALAFVGAVPAGFTAGWPT